MLHSMLNVFGTGLAHRVPAVFCQEPSATTCPLLLKWMDLDTVLILGGRLQQMPNIEISTKARMNTRSFAASTGTPGRSFRQDTLA